VRCVLGRADTGFIDSPQRRGKRRCIGRGEKRFNSPAVSYLKSRAAMTTESAEVASRAREATEAATAASVEAATLEATAERERAALRARRAFFNVRDDKKTRFSSDVPRTPQEAEMRARRTREAAAAVRRARETARMRAAGLNPPNSDDTGDRIDSALPFEVDDESSWRAHESRWAEFCRNASSLDAATSSAETRATSLSALSVPFPSSGGELLKALALFGEPRGTSGKADSGNASTVASRLARARRVAAARWHPDKFAQKFSKKINMTPEERVSVERRVVETYQDMQKTYDALLLSNE